MKRALELPALSPRGTARQRLAPAPAYPAELAAELREADVGEELLYLAWQASVWAGRDGGELLPVLARALVELGQGSTRVKVDAGDQALLQAATAIVGAPGARTPFILEGEYLTTEKLLASEARLVAALAGRLGPGSFAA